MFSKWSLAFCIVIVGISHYVYKPLPEKLAKGEEPWQIRRNEALLKLVGDVSWLSSKLGISTYNDAFRALIDTKLQIKDYEGLKVTDTTLDGVPVRIYVPDSQGKQTLPAVVFYHGGAWMWGSIDTHDRVTSFLAKNIPAVVVSVAYRLAPEHPYPTPLDDCMAATVAFMQSAKKYAVNPQRIAIAGDSAGGNLAAAVALKLRDLNDATLVPIAQMLIYPVVQAVDMQLPSLEQNSGKMFGNRPGLTKATLAYMNVHTTPELEQAFLENRHMTSASKKKYQRIVKIEDYLPERFRGAYSMKMDNGVAEFDDMVSNALFDPYFSPLLAVNLTHLPKAYVLTCEYDILRDEGIMYAKRLEEAGVPVTWVHYEDGYHGIMNFIAFPLKLQLGTRTVNDMVKFLQENI